MKDNSRPDPFSTSKLVCPTCGVAFRFEETVTPPFCSNRCQLIDLGRWLDEEIGVPFEGEPGETPVEYRDVDDDVSSDASSGGRNTGGESTGIQDL
ncbi:DNA gyrase inhibitor YacG [Planctomycetes bacterium CA13]